MTAASQGSWWNDPDFQDSIVTLLLRDPEMLRECGYLLEPDDFKPLRGSRDGRWRWIIADRALSHYKQCRVPLGKLARADVLQYSRMLNLGASHVANLEHYLDAVSKARPVPVSSVRDKIIAYKDARAMAGAMQELMDLHMSGGLNRESFDAAVRRGSQVTAGADHTTDFTGTLEDRIVRRSRGVVSRAPWTFIDPLDSMVRTVGPGQLGLVLAPYKRGKSLFLQWLAAAFVLQRMGVLYVTLEDTQDVVEDRLDSIVTRVPLRSLSDKPLTLRRRFQRFRSMIRSQLKIYDGTSGGTTVGKIESVLERERAQGFIAHALIVDYDDELAPERSMRERRFEIDETYRQLRQLAARRGLVTWTAAQSQRDTRGLKVVSGDKVAEDIGKMRKVTCALSLGKGEWTDRSIYIWVAAHKCDKMEVGCEIIPDMDRMLIYDRDATMEAARQNGAVDPDDNL